MNIRSSYLILPLSLLIACSASGANSGSSGGPSQPAIDTAGQEVSVADKVIKSEAEWQELLTPDQFHILREKGTERAFTGELLKNKEDGVYLCAACGLELFDSTTKYKSGTGWPSFWDAAGDDHVGTESDRAYGMVRTEIVCNRCGGHLGHVFEDGPQPTGLRYCVNSKSLVFAPRP